MTARIAQRPMDATALKIEAARAALGHVEDGMRLGIGTGSTAEEFVRLLAERVAGGLKIVGVPTSERTAALCLELGVPLSSLDETPELDLTIDGADEVDRDLSLIKGGGGALLREKIVAAASAADDRDRRPLQAGRRRSAAFRCRSRSTVSASRRPSWPSAVPRPRSASPGR